MDYTVHRAVVSTDRSQHDSVTGYQIRLHLSQRRRGSDVGRMRRSTGSSKSSPKAVPGQRAHLMDLTTKVYWEKVLKGALEESGD